MGTRLSLTIAALVSANSAFAADLNEDPVIKFDEGRFDGGGLYAGISIGYMYAEDDDPAFPIGVGVTIPLHSEGENSTIGGFVGYTFEQDGFVYGAEYEYADFDMQFVGGAPINGPIPVFIEDAHILRARLGYAINESVEVYGFAGAMYTRINIGLEDWSPAVGAGIDFMLTENVFVGGQYTYSWFEDYDTTLIDGSLDYLSVRVGYKF